MSPLTPEQIKAGFDLLGLATEEDRAKFTEFGDPPPEERQQFMRLDIVSHPPEDSHAELA